MEQFIILYNGDHKVTLKNDMIHVYDNYPGGNDANSSFSMSLVIHNSGNVWCDTGFIGYDAQPGCYIWDGTDWTYWKDLNTPFNPDSLEDPSIPSIGTQYSFERLIGEAPNGDIWMVLDNVLWRYRPSIGGYPN